MTQGQNFPTVPQASVQAPATVEQELSLDDLAKEAAQGDRRKPHGKFRIRVTGGEFKYTRNETELGLTGQPKAGCYLLDYTIIEVLEGDQNANGKKDKLFNGFSSGVTNGFAWNLERDSMGFLNKHGITTAQIQTTVQVDPVSGSRIAKTTYTPWFEYIAQFGGEYVVECKPNKNNPEKDSFFIREYPICFDEAGNPLPKPMPTVPGATPAPQAVPAQAAPVAVPVQTPAPVAEAPVAQPAPVAVPAPVPVAETPAPVAVPTAQPVAVPVAVPTAVPVAQPVAEVPVQAPVPQAVPTAVPTGLPAGI